MRSRHPTPESCPHAAVWSCSQPLGTLYLHVPPQLTPAVDAYSFGMLMYEVRSREPHMAPGRRIWSMAAREREQPQRLPNGSPSPRSRTPSAPLDPPPQLYTARRAFAGVPHAQILEQVATGGARPAFPRSAPAEYARLAGSCWAQDPGARPEFGEVAARLELLLAAVSIVTGARRLPQPALQPPPPRAGRGRRGAGGGRSAGRGAAGRGARG